MSDKENILLSRQVQEPGIAAGGRGPALQPPPGPAKQFNKDELASVLQSCWPVGHAIKDLADKGLASIVHEGFSENLVSVRPCNYPDMTGK